MSEETRYKLNEAAAPFVRIAIVGVIAFIMISILAIIVRYMSSGM